MAVITSDYVFFLFCTCRVSYCKRTAGVNLLLEKPVISQHNTPQSKVVRAVLLNMVVLLKVSLRIVTLCHRKAASAGTSRGSCGTQGHHKMDILFVYVHHVGFAQS